VITIHRIKQGSDEWQAIRDGLYTGTSAEKLLRFGAIDYSLTARSDFSGNFFTKRGHLLEDEAVELYETVYETVVDRPGFVTNSLFPTCGYSPDGLDGAYLIEVKCFDVKGHMEIVNGNVPFKVVAQIHFGMLICGKRKARLIAYNPKIENDDMALHIVEYRRNPAIDKNFKEKLYARR
jgi:hypothetical protein